MSRITITEDHALDIGFAATLSVDGGSPYAITITDPFQPHQERDLEWYFEGWLQFPFTDTTIAERAAHSVKTYGEALFDQIFADRRAYSAYTPLRDQLSQVQIEIVGQSPAFQALHWEALRDPDLPRPLAVDCVIVRKPLKQAAVPIQPQPSPVLNLLVVTARPDEERDVGYRTISRPLIEAIETAQLRVNVELLRPGTFEALTQRLEAKGPGYYQIIHFDAHGGLIAYDDLEAGIGPVAICFSGGMAAWICPPTLASRRFCFWKGIAPAKRTRWKRQNWQTC